MTVTIAATSPRSVFIRPAVPFVFYLPDGAERAIQIARVPARHALEWERIWAEFRPQVTEWTYEESQEFVRRVCKAGIPEPDAALACPQQCQCAGRRGVHDLIDQLGREELDLLFSAVLEANLPKSAAPTAAPAAGSRSTRSWRGRSWLASLLRRRSRSH